MVPMATFLALVEGLIGDPSEKAAYQSDPDGYLTRHGFGELDADDVRVALAHSADTFPPRLAATIDPGAGLGQLTDVDLQHLGLSGFDDFVSPLPDDLGVAGQDPGELVHGADEIVSVVHDDGDEHTLDDGRADHGSQDTEGLHPLHQDVDIDADESADARETVTSDNAPPVLPLEDPDTLLARNTGTTLAEPVGGREDLAPSQDSFATDPSEPFTDPFTSPGPQFDDDAPWMDGGDTSADLDQPDLPEDDILDDVDEHLGQ